MIIQYMSDIHLEFGDMPIPEKKGDVLVLAGDIHVGTRGANWINECARVFDDVIFVYGNHEFYNSNFRDLRREFPKLLAGNVHVLDNDTVNIKGRLFVGATLWADMLPRAFYAMNDSRVIDNGDGKFTYDDMLAEHKMSVRYLLDNAKRGCVVVTHHAPSSMSIDRARYGDTYLNTGYYTDILHFFEDKKPTLWICGHTHSVRKYTEHDIRVVANCRGYAGYDPVWDFKSVRTVKV